MCRIAQGGTLRGSRSGDASGFRAFIVRLAPGSGGSFQGWEESVGREKKLGREFRQRKPREIIGKIGVGEEERSRDKFPTEKCSRFLRKRMSRGGEERRRGELSTKKCSRLLRKRSRAGKLKSGHIFDREAATRSHRSGR